VRTPMRSKRAGMIDHPSEGRGLGHSIEPHAARPAGDAIEEGSGTVCGPKARQLCTVGGCEGVSDEGGQSGRLPCCRGRHHKKDEKKNMHAAWTPWENHNLSSSGPRYTATAIMLKIALARIGTVRALLMYKQVMSQVIFNARGECCTL
jgi:hypothetical protein